MLAAYEQFAEVALAGGVRQPHGDAECGGGQRGEALRLDARGVLGEDEAVDAGRERAGQLGHAGP